MKKINYAIIILMMLSNIFIYAQKDDPLNGPKIEYYPSGKILKEYILSNGQLNGVYKFYSEDGYLVVEQDFVDGVPQGAYKTFYKNGQLQSVVNMEQGLPQGVTKEYYEDGTLKKDVFLTGEPPLYSGTTILYYEDGKLHTQTTLSYGEIVKSISYDRQGRLVEEVSDGNRISYYYDNDGWKHTNINGAKCTCSRCSH